MFNFHYQWDDLFGGWTVNITVKIGEWSINNSVNTF